MHHVMPRTPLLWTLILAGLTCPASAQMRPAGDTAAKSAMDGKTASAPAAAVPLMTVPGILPSGFGDAVDRDVVRLRAGTAAFKSLDKAVAAGYEEKVANCVEHQPHGAMGYHHNNKALMDTTLDVEKPETLVYERLADGTYRLNGVEFLVPISAWTREDAPTIMGQKLKKAEKLGIWYLHVWNWEPSPSGLFSDWNPRVKC